MSIRRKETPTRPVPHAALAGFAVSPSPQTIEFKEDATVNGFFRKKSSDDQYHRYDHHDQQSQYAPPRSISLAYILLNDGRESWALMIGNDVYPMVMSGDIWTVFQVLTSSPVKPNDKMVQRVLDGYFQGWGNWMTEAASELKKMGYRVP
jgi:hypothetical protein